MSLAVTSLVTSEILKMLFLVSLPGATLPERLLRSLLSPLAPLYQHHRKFILNHLFLKLAAVEERSAEQGPDSIALIFLCPFFGPFFGPSFGPFFGPFFEIAYCNSTQSKKFMHMFLANGLLVPFSGLFSVPFLMLLNCPPGLHDSCSSANQPNGKSESSVSKNLLNELP